MGVGQEPSDAMQDPDSVNNPISVSDALNSDALNGKVVGSGGAKENNELAELPGEPWPVASLSSNVILFSNICKPATLVILVICYSLLLNAGFCWFDDGSLIFSVIFLLGKEKKFIYIYMFW